VITDSLTLPWPAQEASAPASLPRLLPAAGTVPVDLRAHLARHGALRYAGGEGRIVAEVAAAGLTGRGGAAFPVARRCKRPNIFYNSAGRGIFGRFLAEQGPSRSLKN